MTNTNSDPSKKILELRQRAETLITQETPKIGEPASEEIKRLLHELNVHQIELELQNEELRNTQLELESSRRKYIDLYEFSPVGLLILDHEGRIHDPNHTVSSVLGIARHKLTQRDITTLITPASQDAFHVFFNTLRSTQQPQQSEIALHVSNRNSLWVRLDGVVLGQKGVSTSYRIAVTNLTEQKAAEAQKQELAAERQRIKVLTDFVRHLAQSIRTPLTAIVTGLYLLGKEPDRTAQSEKIEAINKHVFGLNTVLDQLQRMAALDNLTILERQPEHLNRLVNEVVQSMKPQAIAKKIKLVTQLQEDLPAIPLDLTYMDQVLKNLIDNALRFTETKDTISVRTYQEENWLCLDVSDTGLGIDAETLPHIFKRFFKAQVPGYQSMSGAGLGLSIVQKVIELHHGTISVSSLPGIKTVFTIKLPIR